MANVRNIVLNLTITYICRAMTREETDILLLPEVRAAIEAGIEADPLRVAMDRRVPHAALVATQVKYLQRARTKLPSYYDARCILTPLAFEQSSSEAVARDRVFPHTGNRFPGRGESFFAQGHCVDLTCGLGVDAYMFSRRFGKVTAVERDPALAYLAEVNFRLLGADNVEVVNMPAEEFVASGRTGRVAVVFADPDRRGADGRKLVCLGDCSPDLTALMPQLESMADFMMFKLSPMFDVDEAFRIFGENTRVEVVSSGGECKEVIAEVSAAFADRVIAANMADAGRMIEYALADTAQMPDAGLCGEHGGAGPDKFRFLIVPDVALAKARMAERYFRRADCRIEGNNSYAFTDSVPEGMPGKAYRITEAFPYSPKKLGRELAARGVKNADIMKRDFPYSAQQTAKALGISEGGRTKIAFTRSAGELWAMIVEPL